MTNQATSPAFLLIPTRAEHSFGDLGGFGSVESCRELAGGRGAKAPWIRVDNSAIVAVCSLSRDKEGLIQQRTPGSPFLKLHFLWGGARRCQVCPARLLYLVLSHQDLAQPTHWLCILRSPGTASSSTLWPIFVIFLILWSSANVVHPFPPYFLVPLLPCLLRYFCGLLFLCLPLNVRVLQHWKKCPQKSFFLDYNIHTEKSTDLMCSAWWLFINWTHPCNQHPEQETNILMIQAPAPWLPSNHSPNPPHPRKLPF